MSLLPTTNYKLWISCRTYNHARYIEETMNGFCMQKTDFPFVAIIIDDASTDGEPDVIRNYLEAHFDMANARYDENDDAKTTFAIHNTNANCHFLVICLKYNFYSIKKDKRPLFNSWCENVPYVAFCEGDDYWTNPDKLQKQVSALDTHPECSVAFNLVQVISKDGEKQRWTIPPQKAFKTGIITLEDYMRCEFYYGCWSLHTSSRCCRADFLQEYMNMDLFGKFPYGDMPLLLLYLNQGYGYYIAEQGGCYRYLSGGYNSLIRNNTVKAISDEEKLIDALMAFDEYTKYKYHYYIKLRILRAHWQIERKYQQKPFASLKPKYWALRHCADFKSDLRAPITRLLNLISFGMFSKLIHKLRS